jgi:hypothetical protein
LHKNSEYQMRLDELFKNASTNWKWGFRGSEEVEADFVVGEIQYKFYAYANVHKDPTAWEVEFKVIEDGTPANRSGNRYGITGTGNSAQVMSTVVDITKNFLFQYKHRITKLIFTAKEGSRRDLYARMVKRLLPDWDLKTEGGNFYLTAPKVVDNEPEELNETTEEDRALVSLSTALYKTIELYIGSTDYDDPDQQLIRVGKIGDVLNTSIPALDNITIELQEGEPFLKRALSDGDNIEDFKGRIMMAFWEEETQTIVLNLEQIGLEQIKTSITHELRHALDEIKSGSYPGNAKRYFTPKKKSQRKDKTTNYKAQPAEINARFAELLHKITDLVPKRYKIVEPHLLKAQATRDFNNLLVKYEIADLFPEKTRSPAYQRLVKRAYDFMQKEMAHIESELEKQGTPKKATGSF